jgi:hypothetical protein
LGSIEWIVEFREAYLSGYGLGIELSGVFGIVSCRIKARKELSRDKKSSCVICSYSETVINPLPEYD